MEEKNRYELFISEIKNKKEVWLLKAHDGLYAMFEDNKNQTYLPVWSGKDDAIKSATDDWDGYTPDNMSMGEFSEWLKELKDDAILIGISPDESGQSMILDPMELRKILVS